MVTPIASQFVIDKMVAANVADGIDKHLRRKHKTATSQAVTMALVLLIHRMDKATGSGEARAYQDFAIALLGGAEKIKDAVTALDPSSAPSPDSHSDAGVEGSTESSSRPA